MKEKLGILLYEKVQPIDVIGPWEVFSIWKKVLNPSLEMYLIAERKGLIHCDNGIVLEAHCDFNEVPQFDYLVVPGGRGRCEEINNENLITFIKDQASHCKYILSICTGMFLLYKAGLLEGKSVTTYWRALPELTLLPNIHIVENRIVKNKNIWMSGGLSSGIDLALELIAEVAGTETAGKVQLLFEYFPKGTVYSTEEMIYSLPPYHSETNEKPYLPQYIKDFISQG